MRMHFDPKKMAEAIITGDDRNLFLGNVGISQIRFLL